MENNSNTQTTTVKEVDKTEKILKIVCLVSVILFILNLFFQLTFYFCTHSQKTYINYKTFSDFGEVLYYCFEPERYAKGIIYPPISFLIFLPLAILIKKPIKDYLATDRTWDKLFAYSQSAPVVIILMIYFVINTALIILILAKMTKFKGKKLAYMSISVVCFGPLLCALLRGNIIMTCLPLVLLFFWLYKSEKRWQREIANLCLAMAISIKIYPVFLLVFFVKDRRFLDMLKTFVYALLLLFVPFLFIKGGFYNVPLMWNNCFGFKGEKAIEINTENVSIASLMNQIAYLIHHWTGANVYGIFGKFASVLKYLLLLGTIVVFAFAKKSNLRMQVSLLSILCYIIYQDGSYTYVMIYMLIPIIFYLLDFNSISKFNKWFYGVCYLLISLPVFYIMSYQTLQSITMIVLAVKCFVDIIRDIVRIHKEDKLAKSEDSETKDNVEASENKDNESLLTPTINTEPKRSKSKKLAKN